MAKLKRLMFIVFIAFLSLPKVEAQMYHPMYAYYVGYGTMYFTDYWGNAMCMYQGNISYGFPNGNGCAIWADGSFYRGGFYNGFCHGEGVLGNYSGYIAGTWNMGNFVGANNNYNNNNYRNTVQDVRNQYQQQNSNQNQMSMNIDPDGFLIEKLPANSEMGRTLLGNVGSNSSTSSLTSKFTILSTEDNKQIKIDLIKLNTIDYISDNGNLLARYNIDEIDARENNEAVVLSLSSGNKLYKLFALRERNVKGILLFHLMTEDAWDKMYESGKGNYIDYFVILLEDYDRLSKVFYNKAK
jgi:hypothetical protein